MYSYFIGLALLIKYIFYDWVVLTLFIKDNG